MNIILISVGIYLIIGIILFTIVSFHLSKAVIVTLEEKVKLGIHVIFGWLFLIVTHFIKL